MDQCSPVTSFGAVQTQIDQRVVHVGGKSRKVCYKIANSGHHLFDALGGQGCVLQDFVWHDLEKSAALQGRRPTCKACFLKGGWTVNGHPRFVEKPVRWDPYRSVFLRTRQRDA